MEERYSIYEVAKMLGVSRNVVLKMIERQDIGTFILGKRTFILKSQYEEYLKRALVPPRE